MVESLIIQSSESGILDAERFLDSFCDTFHVANYGATISVAVLQAVNNAVVHGNGSDVAKQVRIEAGHRTGGIYFLVQDQGKGFDYARYAGVPDGEGEGRGLFLIRSLADRVEFLNGGSTLRMEFDIEGIYAADSVARACRLKKFFKPQEVTV